MTLRLDIPLPARPGGRVPFDLWAPGGALLGRCEAVARHPRGCVVSGWTTAARVECLLAGAAGRHEGRIGAPRQDAVAQGHAGARGFQIALPRSAADLWLVLPDGDTEAAFLIDAGAP